VGSAQTSSFRLAAGPRHTPRPQGRYSAPVICEIYLASRRELRPGHARLLDEAERARSARFRQDADRDRFVLGAALLRLAAARHLPAAPASVLVDRSCDQCGGQHGKPVLTGSAMQVSVSHSGDGVAVALTSAGPVGIDIEAITATDYRPAIASACVPAEQAAIRCRADFYCYWTRKEAVLKATGEGLRRPMTDLVITPPAADPVLLAVAAGPAPACQLADVPAGPDYRGAAAVLTPGRVVFAVSGAATLLL
jgi:4'-phosphopantetheinyl transferase